MPTQNYSCHISCNVHYYSNQMSFGTHLPYEEFEKKFLIEFQMVCADYGITIFVTNKKRDLEGRCSDSW